MIIQNMTNGYSFFTTQGMFIAEISTDISRTELDEHIKKYFDCNENDTRAYIQCVKELKKSLKKGIDK